MLDGRNTQLVQILYQRWDRLKCILDYLQSRRIKVYLKSGILKLSIRSSNIEDSTSINDYFFRDKFD